MSRLSLGKPSIVINVAGLEDQAEPFVEQAGAVMPKMKATEREGTLGPRMPLSSAGAVGPSVLGQTTLYKAASGW